MQIGIGLSCGHKDARKAGAEAVRKAKTTVPKPDIALVFGSISLDQAAVHAGVCSEVDPNIVIGGSSYAEITNAGVTKGSVAALLISLDQGKVRFSGTKMRARPRDTGRRLARSFESKPKNGSRSIGILFSSVANGYDNDMLKGIEEGLGRIPVFGGLSCGNYDLGLEHPDFWRNYQYSGPVLTQKGARMALLDLPTKDFQAGFGFEHGWHAIAPPATITRAEGNVVYEVDRMPVVEFYRQFIGRHGSDEFFAKMIQRYGFSIERKDSAGASSVLKLPVHCDFDKGAITYFPAEDLQGVEVRLILASRRGLVRGAEKAAKNCLAALNGGKPAVVIVVSCCTRNAILHSKMDSEVDAVRVVFGRDVPVFGFYSGGEILPFLSRYEDIIDKNCSSGGSHYHATTMGLLALGCVNTVKVCALPTPEDAHPAAGYNEVGALRELLKKSEATLDTTEDFLSNLSRKSFKDGEQIRKQNQVIYRYTPHNVWREIGENVAKGTYELENTEFNGGFLFLDVKGFTSYSEKHGPKKVVAALNTLFGPATDTIYAHGGDVDKYIGDCIFAAFKDPIDAVRAGRDILKLFDRLQKKGHPFSVRIGVNEGRAIRANVGSIDRREFTYIGDAVNLAQRLESNSTPGRMLVAARLYIRAKLKFKCAVKKSILAKGKAKPIAVVEVGV